MSPCTSGPDSYTRPQESAPDRRVRKSCHDGHSYNRCIRPANRFVITCLEANARRDAPFVVLVLARAILLVLNGVRELVTDVAVRAGFAPPVPLLSYRYPSVRAHTLALPDKRWTTHLVAHQTLFIIRRARVPMLKIIVTALTPAHRRKVKEDGSDAALIRRVLS